MGVIWNVGVQQLVGVRKMTSEIRNNWVIGLGNLVLLAVN